STWNVDALKCRARSFRSALVLDPDPSASAAQDVHRLDHGRVARTTHALRIERRLLDGVDDVESFDHAAEDDVLTVQLVCRTQGDVELTAGALRLAGLLVRREHSWEVLQGVGLARDLGFRSALPPRRRV